MTDERALSTEVKLAESSAQTASLIEEEHCVCTNELPRLKLEEKRFWVFVIIVS